MSTADAPKTDAAEIMAAPPCPITGRPPKRRIQTVSSTIIKRIWRYGQGVDVSALFKGIKTFTLWESDTGLVYFEPMTVGDGPFYQTYYKRKDIHASLTEGADTRVDFGTAGRHFPEGAAVIDVGCGPALFRHHVPHARYTGLDPYAEDDGSGVVIHDTLENHARSHAGQYDVASAFHVIEHVPDPLRHAELMATLLKPGGLLILAAPLHPSPLTEIPNMPLNLPPHHVTWWNPGAFTALAERLGLEVVKATALPPSPHQAPLIWINKLLFRKTDFTPPQQRFISSKLSWSVSVWLAYMLASVARKLKPIPDGARPIDTMLIARKPL
jgi:SAM-dependent methyltransferase